jgi:hypothetical protein
MLEGRVDVTGPEVRRLDGVEIAVAHAEACLGHHIIP